MSLLEEAKKIAGNKKQRSPEEIELAISYLKGEISINQANRVLGVTNAGYTLAVSLTQAYREGKIEIK